MFSFLLCSVPFVANSTPTDVCLCALRQAIHDKNRTQFNLIYAALRIRSKDAVFDLIVPRMEEEADREMQHTMLYCGQDFFHRGRELLPVLRHIAGDNKADPLNRSVAVLMLGRLGIADFRTFLVLRGCLRHERVYLRCDACVALWRLEKDPETIVPTLREILKSESDRLVALEAIREIGPALRSHFDVLEILDSADRYIRCEAYKLLPEFATSKKVAAEELGKATLHTQAMADKYAADFRAGILDIPLDRFAGAHRAMREEAGLALGMLASMGESALPVIMKMLQTKDEPATRSVGLNTLRRMRHQRKLQDALKVIPEIEKLLSDSDASVRSLAETTLKELREKK